MNAPKRDFNLAAKTWDENPRRIQIAQATVDAIRSSLPLSPDLDALDFGCGTGLLTMLLSPYVRTVTGADNAHGMLEALQAKIDASGSNHIHTLFLDGEQDELGFEQYDLMVSGMAFHHIEHIDSLLRRFAAALRPSGYVAITDLDLEGGLFHENNAGVYHFGFDRSQFHAILEQAGFSDTTDTTVASFQKPAADGILRTFTVFLITARKRL